jgi:hypothetical protein
MRKKTHALSHQADRRQPRPRLDVALSRGIDQELEWYFVYAETALRRDSVQFVPSHVGVSFASGGSTEDALLAAAHQLARTVERSLRALPDHHASVLRTVYTPRRWPANVQSTFQSVAPLAVRLTMVRAPWPARTAKQGLEDAAAVRLSAHLTTRRPNEVARLKAEAARLFGAAVIAYTKVRVLEGPSPSGGERFA